MRLLYWAQQIKVPPLLEVFLDFLWLITGSLNTTSLTKMPDFPRMARSSPREVKLKIEKKISRLPWSACGQEWVIPMGTTSRLDTHWRGRTCSGLAPIRI